VYNTANIISKRTFIEWLEKQKGEFIVIGTFAGGNISATDKRGLTLPFAFPLVFEKKGISPILDNMPKALMICKKEEFNAEIQKQIDNGVD
jgi:hypothetical protein